MTAPVFTDGVTPLNAANFNALGNEVNTKIALPGGAVTNGQWLKGVGGAVVWSSLASYSATPPGSPQDGDLWCLPADATNGVNWMFRYNAGSASAYKWEFVGGAPAYQYVFTDETTTSGVYGQLATPGPNFTLPRAGDYLARWGAQVANGTVGSGASATVSVAPGVGPFGPGCTAISASAWQTTTMVAEAKAVSAAAASSITLAYAAASAGTASFSRRWLSVTPIRVS